MHLAQCYEFEISQPAGVPVPEPQPQAYQQVYSQRDHPGGFPPSTHRRSYSQSSVQGYNPEYLHPERQSQRNEIRYMDRSGHMSQSRLPPRSGSIRMPRVEPGDNTSQHDCWGKPAGNHFNPAPGPVSEEQKYGGGRSSRRYSYVSPIESTSDSGHSISSRSPSPCYSSSSRHSSRSSEKRVRFPEGV